MASSLQIKRGTRAQLETAKAASGLLAGEPYLITDEARLAVGTAANAYSDAALKSEVDAKLPLISAQTEIGAALADDDVVAVYDTSATAHRKGVMSRVWSYISGKLTGAISGVLTSNLTSSRAVASDASGKLAASSVTSTELGYLSGVTSALQTQLNAKAPLASPALTGTATAAKMLIGTTTDGDSTKKLQVAGNTYVSGYSKLGESAPAIKMKKLTATSPAAQGGVAYVAHGLDYTKIIGVQVLLKVSTGLFTNGHTHYSGCQFDFYVDGVNVVFHAHATNSASILSKPFTVLLTYEE
jgi:hypothetical protein